jgi:outer membrane protein assembly factor BamE (lipoprotein component of BamABCDE complex)
MKTVYCLLAAAAVLITSSCSTPESRIRENPALFAQLTPQDQELIRRGRVGVGFTAEMVRLALGEPDRLTTRTSGTGTSEVWHYITYEMPSGSPLYRGWYHRYYMWRDPLYPWYMDEHERRERERLSVVFDQGRVTALDFERGRW